MSNVSTMDRDTSIVVNGPAVMGPEQEGAVAAQLANPAEEAAQAELLAAQKEGLRLLGKAITAFKGARKAYFRGMIDAGELSLTYVNHEIVSTKKTRAAALKAVDASFAVWSDESVDVGKMIAASQALVLLGIDRKRDKLSYAAFRDSFRQLVERQSAPDGTDSYVLLPGREADCIALANGLIESEANQKEIAAKVGAFLADYASEQRARREQEASAKRQEAEKLLREKETAKQEAEQAARASEQAAQAAAVAVDSEKQAAEQAAAVARADAERAAAAQRASEQAARQAQRDRERAEREAKLAREREVRQSERADRKARAEAGESPSPLVRVMSAGTVKDSAGAIADAIRAHATPTDFWAALLADLDNSPDLDRAFLRSVKAARVALTSAAAQVA